MNPPLRPEGQRVGRAHALYCRLTGQNLPLRYDRQRQWYELLRAGHSLADVEHLIRYLQREIRASRRNVGALKLSNLLQPDRFEEDLGISRLRVAPPPPLHPPRPTLLLHPLRTSNNAACASSKASTPGGATCNSSSPASTVHPAPIPTTLRRLGSTALCGLVAKTPNRFVPWSLPRSPHVNIHGLHRNHTHGPNRLCAPIPHEPSWFYTHDLSRNATGSVRCPLLRGCQDAQGQPGVWMP